MSRQTQRTIIRSGKVAVNQPFSFPVDEAGLEHRLLAHLRRLEQLAFRDYLTQLPNRCAIDFAIDQQFAAFRRYGVTFSVLLADLDDFKRINDRYGHPAGDRMLQAIARSLQNSVREADFPGRWGGEEFIVIAPFVDKPALHALAERLRERIVATRVRINHAIVQITASIGATACRQDDTPSSLIARVDQFLYESKSSGKNRVTCG